MEMAEGGKINVKTDHCVPVVLRVKRKRTADPVEALVIQSKVSKSDTESTNNDSTSPSVFQLCGTLDGPNSEKTQIWDFVQTFNYRRKRVKINPFSRLTISDSREETRAKKKNSSVEQRYKLVSSLRCLKYEESKDSKETWHQSSNVQELKKEVIHLYEVVEEETDDEKENSDLKMEVESSDQSLSNDGTITCNSAVMIREKLNTTEDSVYDIYYTTNCNMDTFDWNTVSICSYEFEPEYVHDILDSDDEACNDDDDDSNDESNWRNDYPDEDEWENDNDSSSQHSYIDEYKQREIYYDEFDFFDQYDPHNDCDDSYGEEDL